MKKILIGFVIIASGFILAGCGNKTATPVQDNPVSKQDVTAPAGTIQTNNIPQIKPIGSAVSSLKSVMGLNKKMKCSYSIKANASGPDSIVYIEGKKFKAVEGVLNTLFEGNIVYMWGEGQSAGMTFNEKCISELIALNPSIKTPENKFADAGNMSCESSNDNVDFSAPSFVTFTDGCERAKKEQETIKNTPVQATAPVESKTDTSGSPAQ